MATASGYFFNVGKDVLRRLLEWRLDRLPRVHRRRCTVACCALAAKGTSGPPGSLRSECGTQCSTGVQRAQSFPARRSVQFKCIFESRVEVVIDRNMKCS